MRHRGINSVYARYLNGEAAGLYHAHDQLSRALLSGCEEVKWHSISELEVRLVKAALRAGYRMALADVRLQMEESHPEQYFQLRSEDDGL